MNPNVARLTAAISNLCKAVGAAMVLLGWNTQYANIYHDVEVFGGVAMILIPVAFDVVAAGWVTLKSLAIGAQAGINMTLAGQALDKHDNPIPLDQAGASATPPKPVTMAKGLEIAQNFGPTASEVPKS